VCALSKFVKLFQHQITTLGVAALLTALCLTACPRCAARGLEGMKKAVVENYAAIAHANYLDALTAADAMEKAVTSFVETPSEKSMQAARQAWLDARIPYLQTEAFRFYEGPIDMVEMQINAWPVDENYIDYVAEAPEAGIINATNKHPQLSAELIAELNEKEGEKNISTGYHAIEFLLWGQDLKANGPGDRSFRDYLPTARNAARRGEYLRIVTRQLLANLRLVAEAWTTDNPTNYRAQLLTQPADEALKKIIKGMGSLSGPELSGERLTVPYATKEQEDEHSCFSDNTHNDVIYDIVGIQNIYLGRYVRTDGKPVQGPGLNNLLQKVDAPLAAKLASQLAACVGAARAIPAPFDQAIQGKDSAPGRVAVKQTIAALQEATASLVQGATALGLKLDL
jgi:putative iron-regulated protein